MPPSARALKSSFARFGSARAPDLLRPNLARRRNKGCRPFLVLPPPGARASSLAPPTRQTNLLLLLPPPPPKTEQQKTGLPRRGPRGRRRGPLRLDVRPHPRIRPGLQQGPRAPRDRLPRARGRGGGVAQLDPPALCGARQGAQDRHLRQRRLNREDGGEDDLEAEREREMGAGLGGGAPRFLLLLRCNPREGAPFPPAPLIRTSPRDLPAPPATHRDPFKLARLREKRQKQTTNHNSSSSALPAHAHTHALTRPQRAPLPTLFFSSCPGSVRVWRGADPSPASVTSQRRHERGR